MSENKKSCCCEGFSIDVQETEKGITINIHGVDAEATDKLKKIATCCGDSPKDCC